jgi:hypothetical protein
MARDNPPVHPSPDEREKMIEEMSKEVRKETVQAPPKRRNTTRAPRKAAPKK